MTPDELLEIEAGELVWAFVRNENYGPEKDRIKTIRERARHALVASLHVHGPANTRPKPVKGLV